MVINHEAVGDMIVALTVALIPNFSTKGAMLLILDTFIFVSVLYYPVNHEQLDQHISLDLAVLILLICANLFCNQRRLVYRKLKKFTYLQHLNHTRYDHCHEEVFFLRYLCLAHHGRLSLLLWRSHGGSNFSGLHSLGSCAAKLRPIKFIVDGPPGISRLTLDFNSHTLLKPLPINKAPDALVVKAKDALRTLQLIVIIGVHAKAFFTVVDYVHAMVGQNDSEALILGHWHASTRIKARLNMHLHGHRNMNPLAQVVIDPNLVSKLLCSLNLHT